MAHRDTAAFAEFAAARSGALFRAAYLMVGDHALAEDLLQEALTKTYVAWPRLHDINNAEAYTRKAITTTAISWWRRKSWHNEKPRGDVPERGHAGHGDDIAERDRMWRELQNLAPRQRAAIVLRYYEDLTEAQTAAALGCSVGTVKSQVFDGLKKLRQALGTDTVLVPNEPNGMVMGQ
ncbi:MAG: SigE family RNA polymerase sigma factor [Nocardioidaceae bacterium]|nr:SigE family RNA polymerase sigma factor [Nocardioidaceae bacterium]